MKKRQFDDHTLHTLGIEKNLPKRNKIKGIAQELLIKEITGGDNDNDTSATKIIEEAIKLYGDTKYFFCNHRVQLYNGLTKEKVTYNKHEGITEERLHRDFFRVKGEQPYVLVSTKFAKNRKWKSLGKAFRAETLFNMLQRVYSQKTSDGTVQHRPCSVDTFGNLRTDYVFYDEHGLRVFESKNYELTHLSYKDIARSMKYPLLFKAVGADTSNFRIIYNGSIVQRSADALDYYRQRYDLEIQPPKLITKYMEEESNFVGIRINALPAKDNYELLTREDSNFYIVDLRPLEQDSEERGGEV